ncbi:hypothetical protein EI94DRAFT_1704463 [Lactarius quietus]|nr:hypothetical protein EI94DRAFT_1704463 [Lactarius quietus]
MSTGNDLATEANENFTPSSEAEKHRDPDVVLLHEATLKDLVHARNRAIIHVLWEHNTLLCKRNSLGCTPIEYDVWDFLTLPSPLVPYIIAPGGKDILFCNVTMPKRLRMPLDRGHANVGTQTESPPTLEDPDTMLVEIPTKVVDTEADGSSKKRAQVD